MVHDEDNGTDPQRVIADLEAEFPGWRVWRTTDAGTWWASRRGPEWKREPRTIAADSAKGLRIKLGRVYDAGGQGK